MSKLIIKASEIANLTDARYFSAREADWLGFSLDSNAENYISANQLNAIREWVSGPSIVAELGSIIDPDDLIQAVKITKPDAVQIGPLFPFHDLRELDSISIIRELIPDNFEQMDDYIYEWRTWSNKITFFLLNLEKNGFSWKEIKQNSNVLKSLQLLCTQYNVMLSLVFDPEDLNEILSLLKPYGLSLRGGAEEKVGMKSFEKLDDIFDLIEEIL